MIFEIIKENLVVGINNTIFMFLSIVLAIYFEKTLGIYGGLFKDNPKNKYLKNIAVSLFFFLYLFVNIFF